MTLAQRWHDMWRTVTAKHNLLIMAIAVVSLLTAMAVFDLFFVFGVSTTRSLPFTFYVVIRGAPVAKGDIAVFHANPSPEYPPDTLWAKFVAGVPGDAVVVEDLSKTTRAGGSLFYVNNEFMGYCKPKARTGRPLEEGPAGVIPPDKFYMHGPHQDSLDSRYADMGWIDRSAIVGRAIPLL